MISPAVNFDGPHVNRISWRRFTIIALLLMAGGILAALLDVPVERLTLKDATDRFERSDLAQMLRTGGFLPFWLIVSAAIAAQRRYVAGSWRCTSVRLIAALPTAVILAGVVAEVVKLLVRRKRPGAELLWFDFRPFSDRLLDGGGLSMPSSHTIVAFAAAFMLGRLYPGARWIFLLFAAGTGFSRVRAGAHFVSDVYVAAILAWICVWAVWNCPWPARKGAAIASSPAEQHLSQQPA